MQAAAALDRTVAPPTVTPATPDTELAAQTLARFLAKPLALVPGSTMTYDGVPEATERADLIAYLEQATRTGECAKPPR